MKIKKARHLLFLQKQVENSIATLNLRLVRLENTNVNTALIADVVELFKPKLVEFKYNKVPYFCVPQESI